MSRAIDRIQFYRPFSSVEEREISFGQQRETVGRRKREVAHPQKRDLLLNRLRNGHYLIGREVVRQRAVGVKLHQLGRSDKTRAWLFLDEFHVLLKIVERRLGLGRRSRPRQFPFAARRISPASEIYPVPDLSVNPLARVLVNADRTSALPAPVVLCRLNIRIAS